jgi:epoxide hydrolase
MREQSFTISVADQAIDDLHRRLQHTRWPDSVTGSGWLYGLDLNWMQSLAYYWLNQYDWRAQERELNRYPQYVAEIDGLRIHYLHFGASTKMRSRLSSHMPGRDHSSNC